MVGGLGVSEREVLHRAWEGESRYSRMQCGLARDRGGLARPDGLCVCDALAVSVFLQFYLCFVTSTVRVFKRLS